MKKIYLVLQNIRSLHNVGSLFRSADAFGVSKVYLCGYTGVPPRKEISKTALGAEEVVPWENIPNTLKCLVKLKREGVKVIGLETGEHAKSLPLFKSEESLALVVGNEKRGVSPQVLNFCDEIVEIPMLGTKESLNVAVAGGVGLYSLTNFS